MSAEKVSVWQKLNIVVPLLMQLDIYSFFPPAHRPNKMQLYMCQQT